MAHVSRACDTGAAERISLEIPGFGRARLDLRDTLLRVVSMCSDNGPAVMALGRGVRGVRREAGCAPPMPVDGLVRAAWLAEKTSCWRRGIVSATGMGLGRLRPGGLLVSGGGLVSKVGL